METRIANLQISSDKHMWKLLGPGMYNARPLFSVTVRELLQNSYDAQRAIEANTPINFQIERKSDDSFVLTCDDTGIGMDANTIHEKFLVLGESGKTEGVGGFGVAKASILGACSSWELQTQDNTLTSEMLGIAPISKSECRKGCKVTLNYDKNESPALKPSIWSVRTALNYIATSNVAAKVVTKSTDKELVFESSGIIVDNRRLIATIEKERTTMKIYLVPAIKVAPYVSFSYGYDDQHTIKGQIIYRLNGLTQYIGYSRNDNAEFNAIVDVTTSARPRDLDYPFTVSREEMVWEYSNAVDVATQSYFVNHLSTNLILREKTGEKEMSTTFYDGDLCVAKVSRKEIVQTQKNQERAEKEEVKAQEVAEQLERQNNALAREVTGFVDNSIPEVLNNDAQVVLKQNLIRSPLGIKTCIKVNAKYKRVKPLINRNIRLLQAMTALIGLVMEVNPRYQHAFGIGLILDDDHCALRFINDNTVYYLCNTMRYKVSDGTSTALTMLLDICHEITHTRHANHDEDFTVAEDEVRQNFINKYGMKALYGLARHIRGGGQKEV